MSESKANAFCTNSNTALMVIKSSTLNGQHFDEKVEDNHGEKKQDVEKEGQTQQKAPDGGWAWVVLFGTIMCFVTRSSILQAFPVMFTDIMDYFDTETSVVAWAWSISVGCNFGGGIIAGAFVERYGCKLVAFVGYLLMTLGMVLSGLVTEIWMLYITQGLICGMGGACTTISCIVIIQLYFDKNRSMASGVSMSGIGIAAIIYGPFVRWLLDTYTWRGTYFILAGITLQGAIFSLIFRPLPKKYANSQKEKKSVMKSLTDFSLLLNKKYVIYCLTIFVYQMAMGAFVGHYVNYSVYKGNDQYLSAFLCTIHGVALLVSRTTFGFVGNMKKVNRIVQYGFGGLLSGTAVASYGFHSDFIFLAIITACRGLGAGIFLSIQYTTLVDIVGVANVSRSTGISLFFNGCAVLFSAPLAGFVFDRTGNYSLPFITHGVLQVLAAMNLLLLLFILPKLQKEKSKSIIVTEKNTME